MTICGENGTGPMPGTEDIFAVDFLTGLHRGNSFVPAARALAALREGPWCCIAIDIQHFKVFNAWFGTEKSNHVLAQIGSVLRELEVEEDAAAVYFGQDSFGLFVHPDRERIQKLFDRIRGIVSPYSKSVGFMPAFGVVLIAPNDPIDTGMLDMAFIAVQEAKKGYVDCIRYFDKREMNEKQEEYRLLSEFQKALYHHEISFYLQPICHVSDGRVVSVEALARWTKPDGTVVSPSVFVPILKRGGFVTELDCYLWEEVCKWLRDMLDRGMDPVPVSVNVAQMDLLSCNVPAFLSDLTEKYHLPKKLLKVEITESVYGENIERANRVAAELQEKGFSVMMDDFGNGYSSLNMLDKVGVNVLKLDMAFMQKDTGLSRRGVSIVESIVFMTKALEIPVIVEGVETEQQVEYLKNMGCRYAQGFHFHRPMPKEQFEELLGAKEMFDYSGIRARTSELFRTSEFLNDNMFSATMLNNILGAVAIYSLEKGDLNITRFNEPFVKSIGDDRMSARLEAIQNYVVKEDQPILFRALEEAAKHVPTGSHCEVRFYRSNGDVAWFRMRFFYMRDDGQKRIFYGQVEDVTQMREQNMRFLDSFREQSSVSLRINLDEETIQYVLGGNTLMDVGLLSYSLRDSIRRTAEHRVTDPEDRKAFLAFFDVDRLREAHRNEEFHENLTIGFLLEKEAKPVTFSTYYVRHSLSEGPTVYVFAKTE